MSVVEYDGVNEPVRTANDTIRGSSPVYVQPDQALAVTQRIDAGVSAATRAVLSDPHSF
jgi:hypothetical protein